MQTFKQYIMDEMGGNLAAGFRSKRTGQFNSRKADTVLRPLLQDADRLLRRQDRIKPEVLKARAKQLMQQFVDQYDDLGDEATDLKGKIADRYTQVKQLLQSREQTVEDCVQMLEQVRDLLVG